MKKLLFGGKITLDTSDFPLKDLSELITVPNNQEVFINEINDISLIVEIVQYTDFPDEKALNLHVNEIASNMETQKFTILSSEQISTLNFPFTNFAGIARSEMEITRNNRKEEVHLAMLLLRMKNFEAEIIISVSGNTNYRKEIEEMFKTSKTIKIKDWSLFGENIE